MKTPPPDKQPAAETLEETAERITAEVAKICGCAWESRVTTRSATKDAILSALRNERERCAKVVVKEAGLLRSGWLARVANSDDATFKYHYQTRADAATEIITAITDALRAAQTTARGGCEHCSCVCIDCAPCGPSGKEGES